ncbi:hypothetical protein LOZ61_004832 [Ophidiomyces ophidiicola]|nr:hypothetical protein LOZ61_004832 [Ophidiomyces ophidiicola]KAI1924666.1 hypothetical protein LOZ60_004587 [Ophidiomyces ophidiicola]KAI1955073.1 hypothetical protein LOZ59_004750 [Ophidiomyces ophidiicola]KAI2021523.1 hypothetical protein LOZ45_004664 [Ophidiomyces ophidiicola]KAI2025471.1 hypothetical protein LOZ48_005375 [Ophidiomyces ophidiicola]
MKTPRLKSKGASTRSRAARRDTSPGVDIDNSLSSLPRAERTSTTTHSVLGARHDSSVSKKKQKRQTRAQRLRQEKGLERAEVVMDKTEQKVAKSLKKGKVVKARRAAWDDLNKPGSKSYKVLQAQTADSMDTEQNDGQADPAKKTASSVRQMPPTEPMQQEKFDFELDGEIS